MAESKRLNRTDWLDAALTSLVRGGIEGVRVERLARDLGVTKGSFYWHFEDRPDLLRGLLDDLCAVAIGEMRHAVQLLADRGVDTGMVVAQRGAPHAGLQVEISTHLDLQVAAGLKVNITLAIDRDIAVVVIDCDRLPVFAADTDLPIGIIQGDRIAASGNDSDFVVCVIM